MSRVHRVIILNKPLKIRGFTLLQWCLMVLAAAAAFALGSWVPPNIKVGNISLGFWVGLLVFSVVLVLVNASEMKPSVWWKNNLLYRLRLIPTQYLPRPIQGMIYPDPTIIEARKRDDDYYVQ